MKLDMTDPLVSAVFNMNIHQDGVRGLGWSVEYHQKEIKRLTALMKGWISTEKRKQIQLDIEAHKVHLARDSKARDYCKMLYFFYRALVDSLQTKTSQI